MTAVQGAGRHRVERVDTCEAVVVGAGLVGATTAASLVAEGLDVAVLEARGVASGATGRTAGLILTGLPTPYARAVEQHGRETAQALWQLTVDNRVRLAAMADRLGVSLERTGSLTLASGAEEAGLLKTSAEMLSADGFDVRFTAKDPLDRGFAGALHYPDDVVVDTVALAERLLHGIPVHTGNEVYELEQDGDDVLVLARGRTVKAGTVVLAVNAYAPLLDDYFADKVAPARGHVLVTHPLGERLIPTPGNAGPFSFRQTSDGRLLFTAWRAEYETPATGPGDESAEIDLMRFVGRHFPEAVNRFAHRSSGVMGTSRDGLPLVGALPHLQQVFFAVGFASCGLSLTFAAADLLTGLIARGAEPALLSARRLE
jgi:gamma-glutamylputrescine oxidase